MGGCLCLLVLEVVVVVVVGEERKRRAWERKGGLEEDGKGLSGGAAWAHGTACDVSGCPVAGRQFWVWFHFPRSRHFPVPFWSHFAFFLSLSDFA